MGRARPARRGWWFRNLPNVLTCSRLVATGFFVWALSLEGMVSSWVALVLFSLASITDWFDGWLARRFGLSTPFGQFMDPLADKVLVLSALLMFLWQNLVPVWMVIIIVSRELLVTYFRMFAESLGRTLPAMPAGKQKMASQIVAIIGTLLVLCLQYTIQRQTGLPFDRALAHAGPWGPRLARAMDLFPDVALFVATALAVWSGVVFIHRHRALFAQSPGRGRRAHRRSAAVAIATLGRVGFLRGPTGTYGSALALLILLPARHAPWTVWAALLVVLAALAVWSAGIASRVLGARDPSAVIIDEVLGMALVMGGLPAGPWWLPFAGFFAFRAFDIAKPPPLRALERLPGGWGIVADDLGAALYALLALRVMLAV